MNTSKRVRSLLIILCGITFWSTAVIANTKEKKVSNIIMLWPKDAASQDGTGITPFLPHPLRSKGDFKALTPGAPRYLSRSISER
tara:strand:- start:421 stop:675 length:255 start_codon:yes stop_codon:yes gene_type:complete